MRIEGYEVTELEPGLKVYHRVGTSHTTFEREAPWIHFHYAKTDSESERDGESEVELCCHGCGVALWVTLPVPFSDHLREKAERLRARFNRDHLDHDTIYVEDGVQGELAGKLGLQLEAHPLTFLCPDFRKQLYHIDLRGRS